LRDDPAFLRRTDNGVTIELRAQPRARRTTLDCSGQEALKAAVTAPAEDGLAAEWHLPKSAFEVTRGAAARDKVLSISGDPAGLAGRIAAWLRQRAGDYG
jgi:uncharacterized protein YggU (UPF0235/DUF167 family)